jgi:hypothetical protein
MVEHTQCCVKGNHTEPRKMLLFKYRYAIIVLIMLLFKYCYAVVVLLAGEPLSETAQEKFDKVDKERRFTAQEKVDKVDKERRFTG